MKIINSKFHAFLDYLYGLMIISSPWLFGFANVQVAKIVVLFVGISVVVMSIITDYEGGLVKIIPMRTHLLLDLLVGIFVAISPWLLGFKNEVYLPHLLFGLFAIVASSITKSKKKCFH